MKKNQVLLIIVYTFLMSIFYNMAHAVTPELIVQNGMPDYTIGVLFSAMATSMFLFSSFWGRFIDKHGRKLGLIIFPIGGVIGQLGFGLSTNIWVALIFRVITGSVAGGMMSTVTVYLTDVSEEKSLNRNLAINSALMGFGTTLGYLLGGYIGDTNYQITFFTQASLITILPIYASLLLIKTEYEVSEKRTSFNLEILNKYKKTILYKIMIVSFLTSFGYVSYNNNITMYLSKYLDFSPILIGYYMAYSGILLLVSNLIFLPFLLKRLTPLRVIIIQLLTISTILVVFPFISSELYLIIMISIFVFFLRLNTPLENMLISENAKVDKGEAFGIIQSLRSLGMIFGSLITGFTFDLIPYSPFYIAAFVFLIAAFTIKRKPKNS